MLYGKVQRVVRLCIGFVFAVFFLVCAAGVIDASPANAATLSVATARTTYAIGDTIVARVYVDSTGQAVNAFQGSITLPAMVDFSSVSVQGSIVSFWVQQPSYAGTNNAVSFSGVVMNPGFVGDRGLLLTIYGRAKNVGSGSFAISDGSVLANDGQGTEILTSVANATVTVESSEITSSSSPGSSAAPSISSPSHPDQTKWYADATAVFTWPKDASVTAVRLVYDQNKSTLPAVSYDPPIWTKTIADSADGTWYFRVQEKTAAGWGAIGTYRVNIDTVAPHDFTIAVPNGTQTDNPRPVISFGTTDDLSGVDHYLVAVDGQTIGTIPAGAPGSVVTYTLPLQTPGQKTVTVTAVDAAGNTVNSVVQLTIVPIPPPVIDQYPLQSTVDDSVVIKGHATSGESIFLTLTQNGGALVVESVSTTPDGTFAFLWPTPLSQGRYQLSAYAVDTRGAQSNPTPPVSLVINQQAWMRMAMSSLMYGSLGAFILFFLIGITFVALLMVRRLRRLQKEIGIGKRKAEEELHQALIRLAAHVRNHVEILEKTTSKRRLSEEESALLTELRDDMKTIEEKIKGTLETLDHQEKK